MENPIKHYVDRVLAISPDMQNFIGAADSGSHDASGQMVYELRKATLEFARAYNNPKTTPNELRRLAAQAEGGLLAVATVLRFTPEFTDELVGQLHAFVRAKTAPAG